VITALLPTPATATVATISPTGVNMCTVLAPMPAQSGSRGCHESFTQAMTLAEHIGAPKTPCIIHTLEKCITLPTHKFGGKITTGCHSVPLGKVTGTKPTTSAPTRCTSVIDLTTITNESDIDTDSVNEFLSAPPNTTELTSWPNSNSM
jgi:hypothetical protein